MEMHSSLSFDPNASEERPRILLVEPSKLNLGVMARRLWEARYRVTTAESARGALAELHRGPVDLVIAELNMPRTSGAELAEIIRGEIQWRDLPILLITGKSDPTGAVRAFQAGADDVIHKPFHFEVLFACIERRIAKADSIKRLRDDNAELDARVVRRAIELGELRDRMTRLEATART